MDKWVVRAEAATLDTSRSCAVGRCMGQRVSVSSFTASKITESLRKPIVFGTVGESFHRAAIHPSTINLFFRGLRPVRASTSNTLISPLPPLPHRVFPFLDEIVVEVSGVGGLRKRVLGHVVLYNGVVQTSGLSSFHHSRQNLQSRIHEFRSDLSYYLFSIFLGSGSTRVTFEFCQSL